MPGLDTNVLVRWLVDDDDEQSAQVQRLLESTNAAQHAFLVPTTVLLELEWVLRSRYRLDKAAVLVAFNGLLETQDLELQSEAAIEHALHLYRQGNTDFADCLHAGLCTASDRSPLLSFDVKAAQLPGIQLITG